MATWCTFLRGVNVGGRTIKMDELCAALAEAGLVRPTSVLASGNVIFETEVSREMARETVESAVSSHFEAPMAAFVFSAEEIRDAITSCPFAPDEALHRYVVLCEPGYERTLQEAYAAVRPIDGERAEACSGHFYWQVPKGSTLDAGFSKALEGKTIKPHVTTRNLNTLEKVAAKMEKWSHL